MKIKISKLRVFWNFVCTFLVLLAFFAKAEAESLKVPDELRPWVSWVEQKHPEWKCAKVAKSYECVWPASLEYKVEKKGAVFTLGVELLADGVIELPAGEGLRPEKVSVFDSSSKKVAAPVALSKTGAHVALAKGKYQIKGSFFWKELPSSLPLPERTALVTVDTEKLGSEFQAERKKGKLWLTTRRGENSGVESLDLSVFRLIVDGSPLKIETLLRLRVAGAARPLSLGSVLPEGAIPLHIDSQLQNVLSPEGELALQLRPGSYEVKIVSVSPQPVRQISFPKVLNPFWPKQEIVSFKGDISFRSVELSGGSSVFPNATHLPGEWRTGATYSVASGAAMKLKELSRGSVRQGKDKISLRREFWPDLDSDGYTVRDSLSGTIRQSSRINALSSLALSRVLNVGEPVLVTKDIETGQAGVELRNGSINLEAVSRLENEAISATGWDTVVEEVKGVLHLPPSWKLIDISGASRVDSSWLRSWSLLDLFFSFLVVVASYRLLSFKAAALVAVAMLLNHQEFLAPRMLFVYLLALIAWYKAFAEESKSSFKLACRVLLLLTLVAFVFDGLAFAKLQFTQFLFPQLQSGTRYRSMIQELYIGIENAPLVWPSILVLLGLFVDWLRRVLRAELWMKRIGITLLYGFLVVCFVSLFSGLLFFGGTSSYVQPQEAYMDLSSSMEFEEGGGVKDQLSKLSSYRRAKNFSLENAAPAAQVKRAPSKALTSGVALPTWQWRKHYFSVNGPVVADQQLNFIVISGALVRLLSALRVLVVLSLIVLIAKVIVRLPNFSFFNFTSATKILLLSFFLLSFNEQALADIPSAPILEELERRLADEQCQRKKCASIESLDFRLNEGKFQLDLVVVSDGISVVLLPGPITVLQAQEARMDGKSYSGLRVTAASQLQLRAASGRHQYQISGIAPSLDAFSVAVPEDILSVTVNAPAWYYEGISDTGRVGEALRFTRKKRKTSSAVVTKASDTFLPSWLLVERNIRVAKFTSVLTEVHRLGEKNRAMDFLVPLLPSEKVNSGDVKIEGEFARVYFPAGVDKVSFFGSLAGLSRKWSFQAKQQEGLSEVWKIHCSEYQACEISGLRPTAYYQGDDAAWTWLPFPGERIEVKAEALGAIAGGSLTLDSFEESVSWGSRLQNITLSSSLRVTKQSELTIDLPENVRIKEIYLNNTPGAGLQIGSTARLLVSPGKHALRVEAESDFKPSMLESVPAVKLNTKVSNITFEVRPGSERWVLWVGGLPWGPSVVFWAKLIVVSVLCYALYYFSLLPTSLLGTILLGVGLASVPVIMLGFPLLWLILIHMLPKQLQRLRRFRPELIITFLLLLGAMSLAVFYEIVRSGLILDPPMLIVGNNSTGGILRWYLDHSAEMLPQPWVFSLPIWCWRAFSLFWAMWLVLALISWLRLAIQNSKELLGTKSEAS